MHTPSVKTIQLTHAIRQYRNTPSCKDGLSPEQIKALWSANLGCVMCSPTGVLQGLVTALKMQNIQPKKATIVQLYLIQYNLYTHIILYSLPKIHIDFNVILRTTTTPQHPNCQRHQTRRLIKNMKSFSLHVKKWTQKLGGGEVYN